MTTAEKLIEFIQKNRRLLFAGFIVIVVGLVGSLIGITVRERVTINAFVQLDAIEQRFIALQGYIAAPADGENAEVAALLDDLDTFAARNSRFQAARAHGLRAVIFQEQERWLDAQQAWLAAANAAPRTYFAPIALWNAAAAAEDYGDMEAAIALYARIVQEHEAAFYIAARAQFSIGRLEEARGAPEAAIAAYQSLLARWPHDTHADFAQTRLIVLLY